MRDRTRCILTFLLLGLSIPVGFPQSSSESESAREQRAKDLDEVARIATTMVDGDVCQQIMTKRSLERMFAVDPKDPFAASDNFDVNPQPYIAVKKTLIRLSRLVPFNCDVNLWMPFKEGPDRIQILIRNVNEWSQFWTWGMLTQEMPAEMRRVLDTGKRERVSRTKGMISVLAPVYGSLGNVVALVEVVSPEPDFEPPQVHARLRAGHNSPSN